MKRMCLRLNSMQILYVEHRRWLNKNKLSITYYELRGYRIFFAVGKGLSDLFLYDYYYNG